MWLGELTVPPLTWDVKQQNKQTKLLVVYKHCNQGSHRLEKYLNLESFLENSLKIKYAIKSTGKSGKGLEKSLNSSIFCRN